MSGVEIEQGQGILQDLILILQRHLGCRSHVLKTDHQVARPLSDLPDFVIGLAFQLLIQNDLPGSNPGQVVRKGVVGSLLREKITCRKIQPGESQHSRRLVCRDSQQPVVLALIQKLFVNQGAGGDDPMNGSTESSTARFLIVLKLLAQSNLQRMLLDKGFEMSIELFVRKSSERDRLSGKGFGTYL